MRELSKRFMGFWHSNLNQPSQLQFQFDAVDFGNFSIGHDSSNIEP